MIAIATLEKQLDQLAVGNQEYAKFNQRIVNTNKRVIGVRLPDIRRLAKTLASGADKNALADFLKAIDQNSYEQVLLAGLTIGYAKLSDHATIELTKQYLKLADSWAHIDSFVIKRKKFDRELFWDFASRCLKSSHEFTARYGVIEMMSNYLDTPSSVTAVFEKLRAVTHSGYYVKIAMSWLYAEAAVDYFEQTLEELDSSQIDNWTRKKALQKMHESRRFSQAQQQRIQIHRNLTPRS